MAVKSESEAIRMAKPRLLAIVAAAGLARSSSDVAMWDHLKERLGSQAFSPHYSRFISAGGFDILAQIVTDCFFVPPPSRRTNVSLILL
ncbi:hypothetical protein DL93DRAFT_1412880 [Clavulina sp. PMI_390]|nr:hypothetical protein DL93DRAFT_1412880 [Clavulina sp. PMI_390]